MKLQFINFKINIRLEIKLDTNTLKNITVEIDPITFQNRMLCTMYVEQHNTSNTIYAKGKLTMSNSYSMTFKKMQIDHR